MRAWLVMFLFAVSGVLAAAEDPKVIRTSDGTVYEGVTSLRVFPNLIRFIHRDGAASVRLDALPDDLRQRFGYDPGKAAAADQADAEWHRRQSAADGAAAEAEQKKAQAIAVLKKKNFGGATYHASEKWIRESRDAEAMRILTAAGVTRDESARIIAWMKDSGKNQRVNVHPEFRKPIGQRRTSPPATPR